ncbi:MAG: hypothetical protein PHH46_11215 [Firmicutes bacterium]|nr:hypothetical protein [Bacillota bacterium]
MFADVAGIILAGGKGRRLRGNKATRPFEMVRAAYVEREICESLDPKGLCFFNVNTLENLLQAEAIAQEAS